MELATDRPAYRVLDGRELADPRAAAIQVWLGSLGDGVGMHEARYEAMVLRSPNGPPLLRYVVDAKDSVVGFLALAPRRMLLEGRAVRAGVLSHFAIRAGHRSLGPALMLLESVLAAAGGRFDMVYGMPNTGSGVHAALKRAGFAPAATLERSVCVLRRGRYLARMVPGAVAAPLGLGLDLGNALASRWRNLGAPRLHARWVDGFDPGMDAAWREAPPYRALASVRDEATLRWRLDKGVGVSIRYLLLEDDAGQVRAWFACNVDPEWPHILDLRDFWSVDARQGIDPSVLRVMLREARRQGYAAVSLRAATGEAAIAPWRAVGFRVRSGQKVIVHWLDPALAAAPPPLHLTYIDQDG